MPDLIFENDAFSSHQSNFVPIDSLPLQQFFDPFPPYKQKYFYDLRKAVLMNTIVAENTDDIEYFLNWKPEKSKPPVQRSLFSELNDTERQIFELLSGEGELMIDVICRTLDLPISKLSSLLLQMEFKGLIKCYPGNLYRIS